MDTLEQRWARLQPHTTVVGPDDDVARPAVILFHGCGGLRGHLPVYAEAARAAGWRAFVVDSFGARGWGRAFALTMVCTGATLRGHDRGGDVLAALAGVAQRADVDASKLAVAGWSHGGWGIMEMLAAPRTGAGELGVSNAGSASLEALKGAFMVYPYVGFMNLNRNRPWRYRPRTEVVIARHDHLTTVRNAEAVFAAHRRQGAEIATSVADGTHSFDEPTGAPPMRHDPELRRETAERFTAFLTAL